MSKIKLFSLYLLFIYIKQKDGKRVSIINLMLPFKFLFCNSEPGLSQKTFLRSKLEMRRCYNSSKNQEPQPKKPEQQLESKLMPMLKSTTKNTQMPMTLSSQPGDRPERAELSMLKVSQKLLSLSESEGKSNHHLLCHKPST